MPIIAEYLMRLQFVRLIITKKIDVYLGEKKKKKQRVLENCLYEELCTIFVSNFTFWEANIA